MPDTTGLYLDTNLSSAGLWVASYVRFKGKQSDNNAGDKYRTKQNEGW